MADNTSSAADKGKASSQKTAGSGRKASTAKRSRTRYNTSPKAAPRADIDIVEDNFQSLAAQGEQLAARFFERLLEQHPEIAPLFKGVSMDGQHKKFFASLVLIVQSLRQPDVLEDYLRGLGARHFHYGVTIEHYPIVIDNLLAVMAELSGEKWTAEVNSAWSTVIGQITDVMMSARDPKQQQVELSDVEPVESSENEEVEHRLAQYMALGLEHLSTPIMLLNQEHIIIYLNQAMTALLIEHQALFTAQYPSFAIDSLIGTDITGYVNDPDEFRLQLADLGAVPNHYDFDMADINFSIDITTLIDSTGRYLGHSLEWSELTEVNQTIEISELLAETTEVVTAMSQGDFSQALATDGELSALHTALNATAHKVAALMAVMDTVMSTLEQSTAILQQQQAGSEQPAHNMVNDAANRMTALASTISQNVESTNQVNQLISQTQQQARQNDLVVKQTIDAMTAIKTSVQDVADMVQDIDDIAFETNLLALNAAVEAARAGNQGQGFSVIAAELRRLAKRSAASVKQVHRLVDDNDHKVKDGMTMIKSANDTLQVIMSNANQLVETVSHIVVSEVAHSQDIEQVEQAIKQLTDGTRQDNSVKMDQTLVLLKQAQTALTEQIQALNVIK